MGKNDKEDFKVGDRVYVAQSERVGRIIKINTEAPQNCYNGYSSSEPVTRYTVAVPFVNLKDTGYKEYTSEFPSNELTKSNK